MSHGVFRVISEFPYDLSNKISSLFRVFSDNSGAVTVRYEMNLVGDISYGISSASVKPSSC